MAARASSLAASCGSLTCVAVVHSTDKSARRNSRPVSKRSHEKARKAAELTCGWYTVYVKRVWVLAALEAVKVEVTAHHREDQEAECK